MARIDGRANDELRPVRIIPGFLDFAEGSALIELGKTRVICAASWEQRVPPFLRGTGRGWITAEYAMLPRSTLTRTPREATLGRLGGRTQEIQRLVGRCLRAVVDLEALGENSIVVDCDVLQADGGTRTAAITASYVALAQAFHTLVARGILFAAPWRAAIAATSVGVVDGELMLDLCYDEDCQAEVDFNVALTDRGEYVEIQATAEGKPFSRITANALLDLAEKGINQLFQVQRSALKSLKLS